jgi:alpha-2-macroglobulin
MPKSPKLYTTQHVKKLNAHRQQRAVAAALHPQSKNTLMRGLLLTLIASSFFLLLNLLSSCSEKTVSQHRVGPEFAEHISGYTSGIIAKNSTIKIQLAEDYSGSIDYNNPIEKKLFYISPDVAGDAFWVSRNLIEFRPSEPLKSGETYEVTFKLSEIKDVDAALADFSFNFSTVNQSATIISEGYVTPDIKNFKIVEFQGILNMTDKEDTATVHKSVKAFQDGKELEISWRNTSSSRFDYSHRFTIKGIERKDSPSELKIVWSGQAFGLFETVTKSFAVTEIGDFSITDMEVIQEPDQYVKIHFSDPILANQDLNGLITIENTSNLTYLVDGHTVSVYYSNRKTGNHEVHVFSGVKNAAGAKLKNGKSIELPFEGLKPSVKLLGNGTIIPNSNKAVLLPFKACNLKAVDVYVTKIHSSNIIQFLQVNDLAGDYEMKRVSKKMFEKTIYLNTDPKLKLGEWNTFSLDLSEVVKKDPGAIYSVEIRFSKQHSIYPCSGSSNETIKPLKASLESDWNENDWQSYDYWYDYEYYDYESDYDYSYDYNERNNPCHATYYQDKSIKVNVLSSDIGIVAKAGGDKIMHVFVNNLITTAPMSAASVEFYDFQQQLIGKTTTNSQGMCELKLDKKPFVVIAQANGQKGYLKLNDGLSLSLSKFDVGGATVQKGVKGFMYAERGVWRPGDSIFVSFMLEDKSLVLPKNHPVIFELYNPQNQLVDKKTVTSHLNNLYDFRTATSSEDPTGNYYAYVKVGNRTYGKTIKIETVKPNRLKVYLDFGKKRLINDGNNLTKIKVKWLHGAVAKNLKAKVDLTVNKKKTTFEKYPKFIFDDPIKDFSAEEQVVFEAEVDENGEATFNPQIFVGENAPGMLTANFVTKVFEKGGDFSIDRTSVEYSPYVSYVGVKVPDGTMYGNTLVTGKDHEVEIATVDGNGSPINQKNVDVKVYKIAWRWWWDSYDNNIASYLSNTSTLPIFTTKLNTSNGKSSFKLRVNQPEYGRYYVQVTDPLSGHTTGKIIYIDWPYEYRLERTSSENATMLNFSTDKETYNTGETVKVTFPSSEKGRALITLETGTKVLKKFTVETKAGETEYKFITDDAMAPNVFVHVTLLQPHANTMNDAPIRLYGVAPIMVEDPKTHLKPVITMDDAIRPNTTIDIAVNEQSGKEMTYTLAIVDDGLLDLTSFKTPDPWNHFYAREALGVKSWDMYDEVLGAFNAQLTKILAVGGDGNVEVKKPSKANRFEPMVRFIGPFYLPASGKKSHKIAIPNYVGSVRVMVVAGHQAKYGSAEKTVPVKNPLMVLGTLPRVLSPTEEVMLPVNVFAMETNIKDVTVQITSNDLVEVIGGNSKLVKFNAVGDEVVNFKLKVAKKIGIAKISIVAKSGSETAKYDFEVDVRSPNPSVKEVSEMAIKPGESWSPDIAFSGIEGTNMATLELTPFPSINLDQRLKYLVQYPHGCLEQTTSAVFPQLALNNLMELKIDYKIAIENNIKAGLEKLRLFQTYSGGFGYWPGDTEPNEWATNYAGHFMIEAEAKGYKLPNGLKENWLKYQKKKADAFTLVKPKNSTSTVVYDELTQAYRLYTLALAGSADLGAMNRLREHPSILLQTKWRLAACYHLVGQFDIAKTMISSLSTSVQPYQELSNTFGNDTRDMAMILETLVLMNDPQSASVAKRLAEKMNLNIYMNTQTTAYSLLAMSKYIGTKKTSNTMQFSYSVNGKNIATKTTKVPMFKDVVKDNGGLNNKYEIKNEGTSVLFAKLVVEGTPVIGDQTSTSNHVKMEVRYKDMDGKEILPDKLEQGLDFIAEVTVFNAGTRGKLKEMTLNQMFPSGWEIHNARMDNFQSAIQAGIFDYQDIRDDRVYTYYQLDKGKSKVFQIKLNATYMGKFYLPTIVTEAMYDETISSRVGGKWVEVVKPNSL